MKPALLLLDLINDVVHENGKVSAKKGYAAILARRSVMDRVRSATANARTNHVPVILVRVGFSQDYREWPAQSPLFGAAKSMGAFQLGTWGTEFHQALGQAPSDFVVVKHRVSPFYGTSLDLILRTLGVDRLLIGGVSTDIAVQSTAREAHDRDYKAVVLEDLCGTSSDEEHDQTLGLLRKVASVTSSADVPELATTLPRRMP